MGGWIEKNMICPMEYSTVMKWDKFESLIDGPGDHNAKQSKSDT